MQKCSFTEFRNELARVLGTCQCTISKANVKPVMMKSVEVEEEEEEDVPLPPKPLKSNTKKDKKISTQSSQIKDLRSKLDQAVAENSQIRELLSPATLTMAFSNALSATKTSFTSQAQNGGNQPSGQGKPFLGRYHPSKLSCQPLWLWLSQMRYLPPRLVSPVRLKMEVISSLDKASHFWGGIIPPKPDFRSNLDTTLKQHYASQLFDRRVCQ